MILLLGALCWLMMLVPLYQGWREKLKQSQIQGLLLEKNLKIIAKRDWIENNFALIPDNLKSKSSDAEEVSLLQNAITQIARKTGVKVQKTKPRPIVKELDTMRLLIELDCEGNMRQLADFIYQMQQSPETLKVEQMRLSLQSEKTSILRSTLLLSKLLILE